MAAKATMVCIRLSPKMHYSLKVQAYLSGTTIQDLVLDLIKKELKRTESERPQPKGESYD